MTLKLAATPPVPPPILADTERPSQMKSGNQTGEGVRRRTGSGAAFAARLSALAAYLAPRDRTLLTWVFAEGKSTAQAARMLGVPRRNLQRRVNRLVRRCEAPEFAFAAAYAQNWDSPLARVARVCVLEGRSTSAAARDLGMTRHAVRQRRALILAMARADNNRA